MRRLKAKRTFVRRARHGNEVHLQRGQLGAMEGSTGMGWRFAKLRKGMAVRNVFLFQTLIKNRSHYVTHQNNAVL